MEFPVIIDKKNALRLFCQALPPEESDGGAPSLLKAPLVAMEAEAPWAETSRKLTVLKK